MHIDLTTRELAIVLAVLRAAIIAGSWAARVRGLTARDTDTIAELLTLEDRLEQDAIACNDGAVCTDLPKTKSGS